MDTDVQGDVGMGALNFHRSWGVDIDDLVAGWIVGVACGHAEDIVMRHFEQMARYQLLAGCCGCGFGHED